MEKELEYLENERAAKAAAEAPKAEEKKSEPKEEKPEGVASIIEIGDFQKVNLRVAQIKACEPVPKADKLLRLTLDDGTAEGRPGGIGHCAVVQAGRSHRQEDRHRGEPQACQAPRRTLPGHDPGS